MIVLIKISDKKEGGWLLHSFIYLWYLTDIQCLFDEVVDGWYKKRVAHAGGLFSKQYYNLCMLIYYNNSKIWVRSQMRRAERRRKEAVDVPSYPSKHLGMRNEIQKRCGWRTAAILRIPLLIMRHFLHFCT